jgi:CDP-4-dehydro-6-deoxyglucose reductase, E1
LSSSTYPLASSTWDEAELAAIQNVVASGQFTMGSSVREFERRFAEYVGSRHCVMVNSGSSANLLMMAAMRYRKAGPALRPGDEVIVPAVSWSTTYCPVYQHGLLLRFVDIDLDTLNLDPDALADAITPATRAVLAVNLLGNPNDFARIRGMLAGRGIVLLEDNCESMGATCLGRQCGTHGLMGTYSTFFSHHLSTMEGGMVVTDDEELHHILLSVRAHGWTRDLPENNRLCVKSDDPFEESYRFVLPGYNVRPLEMSGAVGLEQLRKLPLMLDERRRNALLFQEMIREFPWIRPQKETGSSSWFGFSMVLGSDAPVGRKELSALLLGSGIDCRPIVAGNFARNAQVLEWMPHAIAGELRNSDAVAARGLFVGNHPYPLHRELDALRSVLGRLRPR